MATVRPNLDDIVAHMPGVRAAVTAKAREIEARAKALLSEHRHEGESKIRRERAGGPDSLVSLVDPAALSIEYGHGEYVRNGRRIGASQGLYVMTRAAEGV